MPLSFVAPLERSKGAYKQPPSSPSSGPAFENKAEWASRCPHFTAPAQQHSKGHSSCLGHRGVHAKVAGMDDTDHIDYEAELQRFSSKLLANQNTVQRTLNNCKMETIAALQQQRNNIVNMKDKLDRAKQKLEDLKQQISQCKVEGSQAREEADQMMQELEQAKLALRGKKEEVERHKEILAECVEKLNEKTQWASETIQRNQDKVNLVESSVDLFMSHLGLVITCTHRKTMIFKFTKVSRANPEAEYLLEVGLEGENYVLLNSEPPLSCLPQLQDALNATGKITACIAHVRKLFQRIGSKRPLE